VRIKDLGEYRTIKMLLSLLRKDPKELMGYDDVSLVNINGAYVALKVDSFVESVDLLPGMQPEDIGRKLVTMGVSDFASKGIKPLGMAVSVAIPGAIEWDYLRRIYVGMDEYAKKYGMYVWGGDLSEGKELTLVGCFLGYAKDHRVPRRRDAKPGDLVYATGSFGLTSVAFRALLRGRRPKDKTLLQKAISSVFRPMARLKEGLTLIGRGLVHASIDISDGLAISLHEISENSKVRIVIDNVPLSEGVKEYAEGEGVNPIDLALYEGGEEYELLITIPKGKVKEAMKAIREVGGKLFYLGRVEVGRGVYLRVGEELKEVERRGWEHYRGW